MTTISTDLVYAPVAAGGQDRTAPNMPTKTVQILMEIPDAEESYSVELPLEIAYDQFKISQIGSNFVYISINPITLPTTPGLDGKIDTNNISSSQLGLFYNNLATDFSTTSVYLTIFGNAGDKVQLIINYYSYKGGSVEVLEYLTTDSGDLITTDAGEQILAEGQFDGNA